MKKLITAISVLIAILSISLPAMSQYYEPDFSEIEALGGPYAEGENPEYYKGIEDYFKGLNQILFLQRYKEKITSAALIVHIKKLLKSNDPDNGSSQNPLTDEQKNNLTNFINLMNAYIKNKLKVDNDSEEGGKANTIDPSISKRGKFKSDEPTKEDKPTQEDELTQEDLLSDALQYFANAIALYVDNRQITSEALITYIDDQLKSDREGIIIKTNAKAFANVVVNYMEEELKNREIDITTTTIVTLYSDSRYGKETNDFLDQLANEKGFTHQSKKDTEFEWSERQKYENLAFIFVKGGGDMYKEAIEKAEENGYPVSKLIGDEWSNSIDMLKPINAIADGYKAVTYLNETAKEKGVYWKLGVWDAYTSTIKRRRLKGYRKAIDQACKRLLEKNTPCTPLTNDTNAMTEEITNAMTEEITKIREWSESDSDWRDI